VKIADNGDALQPPQHRKKKEQLAVGGCRQLLLLTRAVDNTA
jgi:hypothetical protein